MKASSLSASLLLACAVASEAATYVVNPQGTGDFPTINAAIAAVVDGDIIELTDGTFTGTGNYEIDFLGKQITLRSQSGDPALCIIDTQGHPGAIFGAAATSDARLETVTITNVQLYDAAVSCSGGDPTISSCVFLNNSRALYFGDGARPSVEGCLFSGGEEALRAESSGTRPTFADCEFRDAICTTPTFALIDANWPGVAADFQGCTFADNQRANGPLIDCGPGDLTFTECTFADNTVASGEAVIKCRGTFDMIADVVLENTILAFTSQGQSVEGSTYGRITATCCDIYGNAGGDYVSNIAGMCGQDGNICADPLFCGPDD